jgi:two-component system sensor histidine kinase BaeS
MKRWSLRARFLLVLIILMVAVFAAITFLIVQQNRITLRNNLITQSKSFAALGTQPIGDAFVIYKASGTIKISDKVSSFTDLDHDINSVQIIDTNGNNLFSNNVASSIKVSSDAAASLNPTYINDSQGDVVDIVQPYLETYGIHRYDVVYGISYQSVNQNIQNIVTSILVLSAGILLVSLGVWYFLINWLFLRPVAKLSQIAGQISLGNLDKQIHLNRNDEIGDLAKAVDNMAASLQADITKLKQIDKIKSEFLMITAHSLRTPLFIIESYIDKIKNSHSPDGLQADLNTITSNVKRLGHFAEDALTISTVEDNQSRIALKPTEIAPVIKSIADEFNELAAQKKISFTAAVDTTAIVMMNAAYFHSALWNILDNAYKFTSKGGTVELKATTVGSTLNITVTDSGIGIAVKELPHLFTKFHRATSTLEYNYEGTGIGLYLTKLIIEQHGGTISVNSIEGKGSVFTLQLQTVQPGTAENPVDKN